MAKCCKKIKTRRSADRIFQSADRFLSVSDFSGADQFLQEKRIYHKKCICTAG